MSALAVTKLVLQIILVVLSLLLTLLIPYDKIKEESDKTRILDAVCGISGLDAGSVKIILTKK